MATTDDDCWTIGDVADFLHVSERAIHERTRPASMSIPHRKGRMRRMIFFKSEIIQWLNGADLEVITKPGGFVIVKPKDGK